MEALLEVICLNSGGCPSVINGAGASNPPPLMYQSPHFHHVMLVYGNAGGITGLPHCPACGELSLKVCPYSPPPIDQAKFPLGQCGMTPGVEKLITADIPSKRPGLPPLSMVDPGLRQELYQLTKAHARGEWNGLPAEQAKMNEAAIVADVRALTHMTDEDYTPAAYVLEREQVTSRPVLNGTEILIVTLAGRHKTTAQLPTEAEA